MRRRAIVLGAVAIAAAAVACADIFHDTDSPTLCDFDAAAPGCLSTGDAGELPICAPDHDTAEARAKHACAWLAACETPIGKNATGQCMVEAILAYDCQANPNRQPKLAAKTFWTAMANVKSCADVDTAVFYQSKSAANCAAKSPSAYIGCTKWTGTLDFGTRISCPTPGERLFGENCLAQGRTCDSVPLSDAGIGNNGGLCLGREGRNCKASPSCDGAQLIACDDAGFDRGLDCTYFGLGNCLATGVQPACVPDGPLLAAKPDITCSPAGEATSTLSGREEKVDCTYVSGSAPDNCTNIPNAPVGTRAADACKRTSGCSADTCSGAKLAACVAGRTVTIDCLADGLKGCNDTISTLEGVRASCVKP